MLLKNAKTGDILSVLKQDKINPESFTPVFFVTFGENGINTVDELKSELISQIEAKKDELFPPAQQMSQAVEQGQNSTIVLT